VDIGELRGLITLKDDFSGPVENCAKKLGVFKGSIGAVTEFAGLAAAAVTAVAGTIVALGSHGAEVADVQSAFAGLSGEIGSTADVMLGGLRRGVVGAISDLELMKMANKALGAGLVQNAGDMETLAAGARMLGKQTGVDTSQAFGTLTNAIASGRTAQLKQLGLFVDSKVAIENYADKLGKSTSELTDAERAQALSAATLEKLRERMAAAGTDGADFGEILASVKVGVKNFTDNLSVAISQSPPLLAGLRATAQALTSAFGDKQQGAITTLVGLAEKFVIGLTYVGQAGAVAASVLVSGFYAVKTIILGAETVLVGLATAVMGVVTGLGTLVSKMPGGDLLKPLVDGAKEATVQLGRMTASVALETAEAAKAAVGNSDAQRAIDKLGGSLINIRGAMQDAAKGHNGLAEAAKKVTVATGEESAAARKHALEVAGIMQQLETQLELVGRQGLDKRLRDLKLAQAKEIQQIRQNEKLSAAEQEKAVKLIEARYAKEVALAKASGDSVLHGRLKLEQSILLATQSGVQKRLTELMFEEQWELQSLEVLRIANETEWTARVELVKQKYEQMREAAQGHYSNVQQAAEALGFKTREELEQAANTARVTYEQMKASGLYTYAQLQEAHDRYKKAEDDLNGKVHLSTEQKMNSLASSSAAVLKTLFGKSKAAAYAATIIETAAAVISSFKNAGGFPWGLAPAAAMAAAGAAQLSKISSTSASFREGTEGLTYGDFGRETIGALHDVEAIVPQRKVGDLAGDIASRLGGAAGGGRSPLIVQLVVSGRKLAEVLVPEMPRVLATHGVGIR
jgi:hypothetical protein